MEIPVLWNLYLVISIVFNAWYDNYKMDQNCNNVRIQFPKIIKRKTFDNPNNVSYRRKDTFNIRFEEKAFEQVLGLRK